ncbi:MAG: hypothetical protein A2Z14_17345 [Chloroflexi bacterium RBG_16_48_8]|nr:MAG: hypothetical protein A2Z14_17345 [Chloroflexi bacterium RBG_16_48_8]
MRSSDKFLIAIVAGVILLIGIAFTVVLLQPEPTYQSEDTPEGVAHNYLLALQKEDYDRAYTYLSETLPGYPKDLSEFTQSIERYSWNFQTRADTTLTIDSVELNGSHATVTVRENRFHERGLFESSQGISIFGMHLLLDQGKWVITDSDDYFVWCWGSETGCQY